MHGQSCNVPRAAIPSLLVASLLQIRYLAAQARKRPPHSRLTLQEHGCDDGMMRWRFGSLCTSQYMCVNMKVGATLPQEPRLC
jgi:hypothetical protein